MSTGLAGMQLRSKARGVKPEATRSRTMRACGETEAGGVETLEQPQFWFEPSVPWPLPKRRHHFRLQRWRGMCPGSLGDSGSCRSPSHMGNPAAAVLLVLLVLLLVLLLSPPPPPLPLHRRRLLLARLRLLVLVQHIQLH